MNTKTCTCGARADITLEAHGHSTRVCGTCAPKFSPMLDYTIRAARPMMLSTGRMVVEGSVLTEAMLSECYDLDGEEPSAVFTGIA